VSGRALLRTALTLPACALALAGCGGGGRQPDPQLRGSQLTIYSSLPRRGALRPLAADVLAAERLAVAQDGGRVGRYRVRLVALDASTPGMGGSDPAQISRNARMAAADPHTVAYLGELATGTSAISIPLLNEAGVLQVSPLDTAMALTTANAAIAGSPERFYPKLKQVGRTFARVVPSDRGEAEALLTDMREGGVRKLALLTDEDPSGRALAAAVGADARAAGIAITATQEIDVNAPRHADAIAQLLADRPDAALDTTAARPGAAELWRELARAAPALQLYAPASLADPSFLAELGPAAAVAHVSEPLPRRGDGAERRFERAFALRYGHAPASQARYGYEAMRSVLAAIHRAELRAPEGLVTRGEVVREYFRTDAGESVLGPYAIERTGDTSLRDWTAFRVLDGRLRAVGAL